MSEGGQCLKSINDMSQEEVFEQVYENYKSVFPNMLHSSGGLPDSKGVGTSDVDVSLYSKEHSLLSKFFPEDTEIDTSNSERTIYKLKGYAREVNIYCSDKEWWDQAVRHRKTELALKEHYLELFQIALSLKRDLRISTEAAWAKVLELGSDYYEVLLDTENTLKIASSIVGNRSLN